MQDSVQDRREQHVEALGREEQEGPEDQGSELAFCSDGSASADFDPIQRRSRSRACPSTQLPRPFRHASVAPLQLGHPPRVAQLVRCSTLRQRARSSAGRTHKRRARRRASCRCPPSCTWLALVMKGRTRSLLPMRIEAFHRLNLSHRCRGNVPLHLRCLIQNLLSTTPRYLISSLPPCGLQRLQVRVWMTK